MKSRRSLRKKARQNKKSAIKRLSEKVRRSPKRGAATLLLLLLLSASTAASPATVEAVSPSQSQAIINRAESLYGVPYVWQGYWWTSNGLDCSEFTMLAYRAAGISLPDDPYAQMQRGYWVSTPRPGDLVFFSEDYSGYPTHVGIYAGRGLVAHESSYWGYATTTPMIYLDGYMGAKRL